MIKQFVKKGNRKVGVLVTFVNDYHGQVGIGWSKAHSKFDKFDKNRAEEIALDRAIKMKDFDEAPVSLKKDMKKFVKRCQKYYKDKSLPQLEEQL